MVNPKSMPGPGDLGPREEPGLAEDFEKQKYIEQTAVLAEDEFWEMVNRRFPNITTGDMEPGMQAMFSEACRNIIQHWVEMND